MIDSSNLASFIGFTEYEVKELCKKYNMEFESIKNWYDGYRLEEYEIYNPKAVVSARTKEKLKAIGRRQELMKQLFH